MELGLEEGDGLRGPKEPRRHGLPPRIEPRARKLVAPARASTLRLDVRLSARQCYMNSLLQTLTHIPYFRKVCVRPSPGSLSSCPREGSPIT